MTPWAGIKAPYAWDISITAPAGATYDLTAQTGVTAVVRAPNGRTTSWALTVTSSTTTTITARRSFASDGNDLPAAGQYRLQLLVDLPSGQRVSHEYAIDVPAKP